ncbi:Hpt domain-containing protein [Phenylobacterium sp. VNQ135]|uniref:Hpt domain-containing protein n=1 Tax=Phenylobacterium sp. VNQ135 TaxID=3400922 RepID=UPI003BFD61DF
MGETDRPDPLAPLRTRFLARAADDLAWIEAGGTPQDELLVRVHKLAGIAGTFGYAEVSQVAAALEDDLREGRAADLRPLISALRALASPS